MNCQHCGTPLPDGAMFCGECGRSVTEMVTVTMPVPAPRRRVRHAHDPDVPRCTYCGALIGPAAVFCPECGLGVAQIGESGSGQSRDVATVSPAPAAHEVVSDAPAPRIVESEQTTDAPVVPAAVSPWAPEAAVPRATPAPLEDVEQTRVVAPADSHGGATSAERYILQFSTGESVVVSGSGLVGRNPGAEPGEYVDEVVAIFDASKSVSKSHIEFGQEAGRFWVLDRFSTNGTVIRQPDQPELRCVPGRRYLVARGTRVDIGDQFFVIS